jgi:hypothetical protein
MRQFFIGALGLLTMLLSIWAAGATPPDASAADKATAAKDNNAFAFDLYARLRERDGKLTLTKRPVDPTIPLEEFPVFPGGLPCLARDASA